MNIKGRPRARWTRLRVWMAASCMVLAAAGLLPAADHGDTPFLKSISRHDARITDLFAFTRDDNLVLALCVNPAIPASVTDYQFASDLEFEIFIDNDSEVSADDPEGIGGTVVNPSKIHEAITFRIWFDSDGDPKVKVRTRKGIDQDAITDDMELFAGLRDDPFIRGPRIGKNVAAIVIEVPLSAVLTRQDTVLVWATSRIRDVESADGRIMDMASLALRNQFPENLDLNFLHPKQHEEKTGLAPDVIIFDTSEDAEYPNGRELTDDVVDLVGDPRPLSNDAPFPTANDVPFLDVFPYLAAPQP